MKKAKWIIGAFLLGQVGTLFYKDEKFKDNFDKSQGFDKCKLLFNSLVDLNKKIFYDIKTYDYNQAYTEIINFIEDEKTQIETTINEWKEKGEKITEEKVKPLIAKVEKEIEHYKTQISDSVKDINKKYEIESKIEKSMDTIKDIINKAKNS